MIRAMMSEWLKIMLEEIARKQAAAEAAAEEERRRHPDRARAEDRAAGPTPG
jgi:hypothetical protein